MQGFKRRVRIWHKEYKAMMPSAPLWKCDFYTVDTSKMVLLFSTGFEDRAGKKIYEGDILKLQNAKGFTFYGKVEIIDGCFDVVFLHGHKEALYIGRGMSMKERDYLKCFIVNRAAVIIGNEYQNPELLAE